MAATSDIYGRRFLDDVLFLLVGVLIFSEINRAASSEIPFSAYRSRLGSLDVYSTATWPTHSIYKERAT